MEHSGKKANRGADISSSHTIIPKAQGRITGLVFKTLMTLDN